MEKIYKEIGEEKLNTEFFQRLANNFRYYKKYHHKICKLYAFILSKNYFLNIKTSKYFSISLLWLALSFQLLSKPCGKVCCNMATGWFYLFNTPTDFVISN